MCLASFDPFCSVIPIFGKNVFPDSNGKHLKGVYDLAYQVTRLPL